MSSIIIGSNQLITNFYSAYFSMLGLENEYYSTISVGIKRATVNNDIINVVIILENREDLLSYNKMKDTLDLDKKNIILICTTDDLKTSASSSKVITFCHRDITADFATSLSRMQICKPYMQEENQEKSPEKLLEYIKFMLVKSNITLPIKNECALNVLSALDSETITFKTIAEMTQGDPVLHSGLIKMSNSVYFGGAYNEIKDLEKALVRVGLNNTKAYLINFINKSIAANKDLMFATDIQAAVTASLQIASLSYVIAGCFKVSSPTNMFSVGLLSKLGEIFIYAALSDYLAGTAAGGAKPEGYSSLIQNNSLMVGGMLLKKWKFTEEYFMPILNSKTLTQNKYINETRVLHLATGMASYMLTDQQDDGMQRALEKCQVTLQYSQLEHIKEQAKDHLKAISAILSD